MTDDLILETGQKIQFAMSVHCHQPVYNFESEIEKAYERAYLPLVNTLEEYPAVKMTFHFSGGMLEWFGERRPEFLHKLKRLNKKGQIEFLGGGCYEPLLPFIPLVDRIGQLEMNKEKTKTFLDIVPEGIWLAERLWSPELIDTLAETGVKYTIVDDSHLMNAGVNTSELCRPYKAVSGKNEIILFPARTFFRYSIPFRKVKATIEYLRAGFDNSPNNRCFFFADDGEKFGAWPYTYRHVYKKRWLSDFFYALTASSKWLESRTYSKLCSYADKEPVEVPEFSYPEMMKWSGGGFRNFSEKYPESSRMQKRMFSVSEKIDRLKSDSCCIFPQENDEIVCSTKQLYKAQSGCAYWHGAFAGIYQHNLRNGVYKHLISAEESLRGSIFEKKSFTGIEIADSGTLDEFSVKTENIKCYFSKKTGNITELDILPARNNITNVITRRPEGYHKRLERSSPFFKLKRAKKALKKGEKIDIHDILGVSQRGLKKDLHYDKYERRSFMTHISSSGTKWMMFPKGFCGGEEFLEGAYSSTIESDGRTAQMMFSKEDFISKGFRDPAKFKVDKKICFFEKDFSVEFEQVIRMLSPENSETFDWVVEFNFSIFDEKFSLAPSHRRTGRFVVEDNWTGYSLECCLDKCYTVLNYPIYTINQTERGLKRTFQGTSFLIGEKGCGIKEHDRSEINIKINLCGRRNDNI